MGSGYLSFWPQAAVLAFVEGDPVGDTKYIYSRVLPTNGFTEVVYQFEVFEKIINTDASTITVTPEISNDGINWQTQTGDASTAVSWASSYPTKEVKKVSTIAAFMRFRIALFDGDTDTPVGGTIQIVGTGRT